VLGVAAAIAMLALAAGAFGYFVSTGSGSASASAGNTDPVSLEAQTPTSALYPGTSADVAVKIVNPNPTRVFIPSLVLDTDEGAGDSGFDVDSGHTGCDISALAYTTQTNGGNGWFVSGTDDMPNDLTLHLTDAIEMDVSAANECQGATFTVYLAVGT
jgi:hypothetical protein